jgi:hypothetical protein
MIVSRVIITFLTWSISLFGKAENGFHRIRVLLMEEDYTENVRYASTPTLVVLEYRIAFVYLDLTQISIWLQNIIRVFLPNSHPVEYPLH